ncbi:hypothetical protein BH11PSE11_BH11PSE11_21590 [soil metagenome]
MNTFRKSLLIGAAVMSLGATAFSAQAESAASTPGATARTASGEHRAHGDRQFGERFKEHRAKRLAALHDKLKLNTNQEADWTTFVTAMTPAGKPNHLDRAAWEKLTVPERMEKHQAMVKQRDERMAARLAATKTFYAALTPEQQKVFNENFGKGHGRRHHAS